LTIPVLAANATFPSSNQNAIANQINQGKDFIAFVPSGTLSTPGAGTADWFTIGTLTVPTWATQARISLAITDTHSGGVTGQATIVMKIGSVSGRSLTIGAIGATGSLAWHGNDKLTGLSTGAQTFKVTATFVSGSVISVGTNSAAIANIDYLP